MPTFSSIDVYPYSGHVDRPWSTDPDVDAFAKSARRVCEGYSRALAEHKLQAKASSMQLLLESGEHDEVRVSVNTDYLEGGEGAHVALPAGIASLPEPARALLALDVVHGAALRLAQARSMDADRLQQVRKRVLAEGLRFVWTSPPKASPDRRHAVTASFELAEDGFGRAQLLVHRRSDQVLVATSPHHLAYATSEGFARAAKTVRWRGSGQVQFVPFSNWLGQELETVLIEVPADAPDAISAPSPVVEAVTADLPRPLVVVEGRGADAPEGSHYPDWIQGGVSVMLEGFEPFGYPQCLQSTIAAMASSEQWQQWWEQAQQPGVALYIHLLLDPEQDEAWTPASLRAPGALTARRFKDRVEVTCRSTIPQVQGSMAQMADWASVDIKRVVDKLQARFGLADPPDVPELDRQQLDIAQQQAQDYADARALDP